MAPQPASIQPAQPSRTVFDPWNSSSTGHQRAENRLSTSTAWRASRTHKLASQFGSDSTGGRRVADTVGAGSTAFGRDGRKANGGWERGASGLRGEGQRSLWDCGAWMAGKGGRKEKRMHKKRSPSIQADSERSLSAAGESALEDTDTDEQLDVKPPDEGFDVDVDEEQDTTRGGKPRPPQIFRNLTFYINGSTMPLVSDHKLKHLLSTHGGRLSVALGRRIVTHVIVGVPCSSKAEIPGCGGGLAASKIQKEVTRIRGKGVKFVGVGWVLASVKAGTRLSEARFETVKIGGAGQRSVLGMFEKGTKTDDEKG